MPAYQLLLVVLLVHGLAAHDNDGCPHNFRRCNDECLDKHNNHTVPCEQGPWGKCLSATFPFFCPLTNTCIKKDQICGEDCFDGSPGSFWYDMWYTGIVDLVKCGKRCHEKYEIHGFHDCEDECLPVSLPCKGICLNATTYPHEPQWKCGNECRPHDEYGDAKWRECPDGSCRDKGVECDSPLPGSCPEDQVLCRYHSWM